MAPALEDFPTPKFIEGGCVCGSLRYRVDFPQNHDFRKSSTTCQCTQCRKQTGSLFFMAHHIEPASAFRFTSGTATKKAFRASPVAERIFCSECGAFLYWQGISSDKMSISVGSIDPLYLFGEGAGTQNDDGAVPEKGYGLALANGGGAHLWCMNEIPGVTDNIPFLAGEKLQTE